MIYGFILIASVLFLPNGLESLVPKLKAWLAGRGTTAQAARAREEKA
jgi:hypothetical protein